MALRNILTKGDSALYKKSRPVTDFNKRIETLLDDMAETLFESGGVGLAAPQVGVLRRAVLVMETNVPEGEEEHIIELINPEIIHTEGTQDGPEGCLSVPDLFGYVERPMNVTVRAQNRHGETFEVSGTGLTARAFCHELDHLDGHLFTELARDLMTSEEFARSRENGEAEEEDGSEPE